MSNFSYPCEFPVGITILDLTGSGTTIADLDLAAARKFVARWMSGSGPLQYFYNEWDDNYVGSMWPVGMSLADAMYYYWNTSILNFTGMNAGFYNNEQDFIPFSMGSKSVQLISNFRNFSNNYGCPPFGYNAANSGDQFYASKIVANNNCLSAQATNHDVISWNYGSCNYFGDGDYQFEVTGFDAFFSEFNLPFYGGDGTRESLRQNYPALIKIGNTYYPAIHLSFYFGDNIGPDIYGDFNATTYEVLYNGRRDTTCDPDDPEDPPFAYTEALYQQTDGPYMISLSGFPSGNSYQIPVYNVFTCSGDDRNECPSEISYVRCGSIPVNVEMGSISITKAP